MATGVRVLFNDFRVPLRSWLTVNSAWGQVTGRARYSQYPPAYIKPVYLPAKLEELERSGDAKQLEYTPVRAAYNTHTSSVFHDPLVRKFTNHIMKTGNKCLARELVEKAFQEVKRVQLQKRNTAETEEEKEAIVCDPLKIFKQAVENGRPVLQLVPIKRGGVKYQGRVVKKKQDLHRQCEANRAYAHYRWS
ncbi:hypothetical protein O3P69_020320 [Scylla paramamosain]|uniref:Small ribosomal subunit protein uS7 domain-containing protein n=1 Tax=Scylla paramamosain TaxID=85552 RepID=A0AAW0SK11_SCYPA